MATGTIGSNPGTNDWLWDQSAHQAWVQNFSIPYTIARMIQVNSTFAGFTSGSGGAVAWQNTTAVMSTTGDSVGAGNQGTGGGTAGHSTSGDIPTSSSDNWQFGCYVSTGIFCDYHDDGGSSFTKASAISAASGGTNFSAYAGRTGSMIAYGTYYIIEFYQRVTGAWQRRYIGVRRSGSMTNPKFNVRRSGSWTQVRLNDIAFDYEPVPIRFKDGTDGLIVFEGPFYLGPQTARDFHLHGRRERAAYELSSADHEPSEHRHLVSLRS